MAVHADPTLPVAPISLELWHGMIEAGLLEDSRVELVDGMMMAMSPNGPLHVHVIQELQELLLAATAQAGLVLRVQMPLTIRGSEPEPDLAIVARGAASPSAHPVSAELVIEVACSSHAFDRGRKAELYAEAGVPEYWVVDVPGRAIEVFTTARVGRYAEIVRHEAGASLAPAALPGARIDVAALLPAG